MYINTAVMVSRLFWPGTQQSLCATKNAVGSSSLSGGDGPGGNSGAVAIAVDILFTHRSFRPHGQFNDCRM